MFVWNCPHCDASLSGISSGEANRSGREHLLEHHRGRLEQRSFGAVTGERCQSGCGYRFPPNPEDIDGFVCPECGTDNLPYIAGKVVWEEVERR